MEFLNKHIHSDFILAAKNIPNTTIDLTVTSPPYDDIRTYNNKVKTKNGEKYSFNFDSIVDELYRITKDGGIVVWVVGDQVKNGGETGNSFRQALSFISKGFLLYDTMDRLSLRRKDTAKCLNTCLYFQRANLRL